MAGIFDRMFADMFSGDPLQGRDPATIGTSGPSATPPITAPFTELGPWGAGGGPVGPGPFPAAPGSGGGSPLAPTAAAAPQAAQPYNALFSPDAPGGFGVLGRLMGNPSAAQYEQQRQGAARTAGFQRLSAAIASGVPAQQAILEFINTPEGAEFIATSPDPATEMKQFLGISTGDPAAAVRQEVFGGGAAGGQPGALDPNLGMGDYLQKAQELAAAGDIEGAKVAMDMAEEARLGATPANMDEPSIKRYNFYVSQEVAAGRVPQSYREWSIEQTKAGVQTPEGQDIAPALVTAAIKYNDTGDVAMAQYEEAQQFREIAKNANTGWIQAMSLPFKQMLRSIGVTVDENLPEQELVQAMGNQMALRLRNPESGFGLTGNTSNFDLQFLRGATAGLDKTPEANYAALLILGGRMRRTAALEYAKAEYIQATGKIPTGKDWDAIKKDLIEQTPLLTQEESEQLLQLRRVNGLGEINMEGVNASAAARDSGKAEAPIDSLVVGGAAAASPVAGANGAVPAMPQTFLPDQPPELRQKAWEIYFADKNKGTKTTSGKGDRVK